MTQRPIGKASDKSRIQLDGTQLFLQSSINSDKLKLLSTPQAP